MSKYKIGVIGGDGIGPEVTAEALKVVRAAGVSLDTKGDLFGTCNDGGAHSDGTVLAADGFGAGLLRRCAARNDGVARGILHE